MKHLALIGCGRIGKMHLHNIQHYIPDARIDYVLDDKLDNRFINDNQHLNFKKTDDYETVLQDPNLDAVIISAPSSLHIQLIKLAIKYNKHVFCEKPIAFSASDIQSVIDLLDGTNIKCQVGFNRRFDPNFCRLKSRLELGEIGDIHIIKITNRDPKRPDLNFISRSGGLFLDFNIHDFDMLRFLTGARVTEIFSNGACLIDKEIEKYQDIDTALISLRLDTGALCIIDTSREAVYGYDQRIEVFGEKGCLIANNLQSNSVSLANSTGIYTDTLPYSFVERYHEAFIIQMQQFIDYLNDRCDCPVGPVDAMYAVQLAAHAKTSYQQKAALQLATVSKVG